MVISDTTPGKDYSIAEIVEYIKKENPHQLMVSVDDFFKGDDLKLFFEAVKKSDIKNLKLSGHSWFESEADFSTLFEVNVLDRILNPINSHHRVNLNFLVKNEERVNKVLNNEEISQVLKSYAPFCQTFKESCAAYSILNILYNKDKNNDNIYTELSIYKEIWEKAGDISNPIKIANFLKKNGYNIDLDEDKVLSNNMIKMMEKHVPAQAAQIKS